MKNNIFPSILDATPENLVSLLNIFQKNQINGIHVDVMDNHYVPGFGFNERFVKWLHDEYSFYLDLHLMISNPEHSISRFVNAGANGITLHSDCDGNLYYLIQVINSLGLDSGIALNPGVSPDSIESILPLVHHVLVMTTNPGRSANAAILEMDQKIKWLNQKRKDNNLGYRIEVDGGITAKNIKNFSIVGCNDFVSGKYLITAKNSMENVNKLFCEINDE